MDEKISLTPDIQFAHQYGQFESSQLSNTFLDGLRPIAESSAIRSTNPRNNATYSLNQNESCASPSFVSPSSRFQSLNILNLDSLSSKLLPLSAADFANDVIDLPKPLKVKDEAADDCGVENICLNEDELRHLEEAFSDLSTGPKDTGAIATAAKENVDVAEGSPSGEETNASSMPSLSSDSNRERIEVASAREDAAAISHKSDIRKNQLPAPFSDSVDSGDVNLCASSDYYFYGRPLSTIHEWQSRESFSSTTAYQGRSKVRDSNGEDSNVNETSASVFMAKLSTPHIPTSGPRTSGILQSSQITNSEQSSGNSKMILSDSQIKSVTRESGKSSIFDEGENENSCRIPVHLFSPLASANKSKHKKHADTMQHSFDFGQMAYFVPGIGYQYSNGLSDSEGENKENFKSHASPIPAPRTSLLMKQSNSQSMSVPPLDLSALAQITPSTTTTASAAVVGVPKSSTSQSSFEANSLSTKPFLSAIITEMKSAKAEDSSAGTYAIATGTSSQDNEKTELKDAKTTCEVDLCSMPSEFRPASLDGPTTNSDVVKVCANEGGGDHSPETETSKLGVPVDEKNKFSLLATSRCLFWRACTYGYESKQSFVLRQDSDRLMRVKLQITDGKDFFILLDHRGQSIQKGSRVIDLPPRLACTVTVLYKPRPPLFWHTGILAFRELPRRRRTNPQESNARCYLQRLIGYVAGSIVQCDFCRGIDEKTYWTSAFSSPVDVDRPVLSKRSFYARVSINNIGLRTAWIFAVAMRPNSDENSSLTPLPGVCIKPARFVLRPSQSRDVIISMSDQPREIQVLFYNGDEILRYQCRKMLALSGQSEPSPPSSLPKPHHRLRSAYIMQLFDGELQDMSSELSICVSEGHYNWHGALQDEQRSRAPLSLTIYPLLTEAANISFEASSSLIIGKHMEEEGAEIVETGQTPLATTAQADWATGNSDITRGCLTSFSMGDGRLTISTTPRGRSGTTTSSASAIHDDLGAHQQSTLNACSPTRSSRMPLISVNPDSQLIFAPCKPGLLTSAALQIQLVSSENAQIEELKGSASGSSTNTTSSRRSLALLWCLTWNAKPVTLNTETEEGCAFSYLITPRPLIVEVGETYHLPFCFRPPRYAPSGTHFSQRWLISFHLSRNVTCPVLSDEIMGEPTHKVEILFVGDTLDTTSQPLVREPRVVVVKPLLKCKSTPIVFRPGYQQYQKFDLINTSHNERLIVTLGNPSSPAFELVKPMSRKFSIEPRSSVSLHIQCRFENAPENEEEFIGSMTLRWSTEAEKTTKCERTIDFRATR